MIKGNRRGLLMAVAAFLAVAPAEAANLQWTFTNAVLTDGTAVTGSFQFNADTGVFSNINVTTAAGMYLSGSAVSAATFNSVNINTNPVSANFELVTTNNPAGLGNTPVMILDGLSPALADAGQTVSIAGEYVAICNGSTCDSSSAGAVSLQYRIFNSGTLVSSTPVVAPPPSVAAPALSPLAMALLAVGLVGTGLLGTRKLRAE
jgi:hypothetical protein